MTQTISISTSTILKIFIAFLALIFIKFTWDILAALFLAVIIASAIDPTASLLERHRIPRFVSVLFIYLLGLGLLAVGLYFIAPPLVQEIRQLTFNFPLYYEKFISLLGRMGTISGQYPVLQLQGDILNQAVKKFQEMTAGILPFIWTIFGGIFTGSLVLVISFFLALEKDGIKKFLEAVIPANHRSYGLDLLERAQNKMRGWLKGRFFSALIIGLLVYIGLSLLKVEFAVTLALIAALLEFIPLIGPWLSGIIGVIVAALQSLGLALLVALLYFLIQQIESNFITPSVMRKTTGLHPVVIILVLLVGARFGGILGMLVSIPFTAILVEFLGDLKKANENKSHQPSESSK